MGSKTAAPFAKNACPRDVQVLAIVAAIILASFVSTFAFHTLWDDRVEVGKLFGSKAAPALHCDPSHAELSSLFSYFFVRKIRNIRDDMPECDNPTAPVSPVTSQIRTLSSVDEEEVVKLIMRCSVVFLGLIDRSITM
ncbi:hypothetical protein CAPTEDRAFT_195908 [Capitella teleta]|uniref:Uncharacterized protein n=1 Tax=Capitella teleta TaxID=283909 RepID=R7TYA2_CAPTE|nr:hypothetical protein CAPTEDRAFT_195908 [Capitella teleta]|eukprot:ELT98873.1 hypothetical protein CAPTEDRAFT_195908 [Capitella teleta]